MVSPLDLKKQGLRCWYSGSTTEQVKKLNLLFHITATLAGVKHGWDFTSLLLWHQTPKT
jgi:hypothetical protein